MDSSIEKKLEEARKRAADRAVRLVELRERLANRASKPTEQNNG